MSVAGNYQHGQLSACHLLSQYAATWFCLDNGKTGSCLRAHTNTHTHIYRLPPQRLSVPFILSSCFGGPKLIDECARLINQAGATGNRWARAQTFRRIWHICIIWAALLFTMMSQGDGYMLTQIYSDKRSQLPLTHSPVTFNLITSRLHSQKPLFFYLCLSLFCSSRHILTLPSLLPSFLSSISYITDTEHRIFETRRHGGMGGGEQ